jgi:FkbM family methyltransferase
MMSIPVAAVWMHPGVRLPLKGFARSFSVRCDAAEGWRAGVRGYHQLRVTDQIRTGSRVERKDDSLALLKTPFGPWWLSSETKDDIYAIAEQERDIYGAIHTGDVVLDCGANIGIYTKYALRKGARLVVAIEPVPEILECLRRNLAAEINSGKVIVYPKGVWDHDDTLPMHISAASRAASSFTRKWGHDKSVLLLPLTTIDKLVSELHLPRVDVIKMDIEGAERHALQGARETIKRFHPRMSLCVYHLPDDPVEIPRIVNNISPDHYRMHFDWVNFEDELMIEVLQIENPI